jgi:hypothetical protein
MRTLCDMTQSLRIKNLKIYSIGGRKQGRISGPVEFI